MSLEADSERTNISNRAAGDDQLAAAEDISGGVSAAIGDVDSFTLYLSVGAAVDVTVEATPDGGSNWYVLPESPVKFSSAGDDAVHIDYNMTHIRLTGSNTSSVTAQFREVV